MVVRSLPHQEKPTCLRRKALTDLGDKTETGLCCRNKTLLNIYLKQKQNEEKPREEIHTSISVPNVYCTWSNTSGTVQKELEDCGAKSTLFLFWQAFFQRTSSG
jgi:hypothetical protein